MGIQYCIYYNDRFVGTEDDFAQAKDLLISMIEDAINSGAVDDIDLSLCQITSVPVWVNDDGEEEYDFDAEEVEYCADASDEYNAYWEWGNFE